jgi:hypothetical protein
MEFSSDVATYLPYLPHSRLYRGTAPFKVNIQKEKDKHENQKRTSRLAVKARNTTNLSLVA